MDTTCRACQLFLIKVSMEDLVDLYHICMLGQSAPTHMRSVASFHLPDKPPLSPFGRHDLACTGWLLRD